jgi:head-tail adaptor
MTPFRAGKLDRSITILSVSETIDAYGAPVELWTYFGDYRAELVVEAHGSVTSQTVKEGGAVDSIESIFTFRTRWINGLTVAERLQYDCEDFDIIGLIEIPRCRGWEIKVRHRGL